MSMLIGSVRLDSPGLANMAAVSLWAFSALGIFGGVMAAVMGLGVTHATGEARDKIIAQARDLIGKTTYGPVRKTISWLMTLAIVLMSAYVGLIATAVMYCLAVAATQFGKAMIKSALADYDAEASAA